jgi:hypothetical protein
MGMKMVECDKETATPTALGWLCSSEVPLVVHELARVARMDSIAAHKASSDRAHGAATKSYCGKN